MHSIRLTSRLQQAQKSIFKPRDLMHHSEMMILTDIGGTYARFGLYDGATLDQVEKYKAAEHESFEAALKTYCSAADITDQPALYIATAAYPDAHNIWRFVNHNPWQIDPTALKKAGWDIRVLLNDFEAAAWALGDLDKLSLNTVKPASGKNPPAPLCLLGPGTGLGLAYLNPAPPAHVQQTHGGHMLASYVTDEQWDIGQRVGRLLQNNTPPVFEHFVSGPGLVNLYNAVLEKHGKAPDATKAASVLEHYQSPEAQDALRLCHEFLGLFAHTAVVTGHAYGGVYMTGGLLERLNEAGLFDAALFSTHFMQSGVRSVEEALANTPVYIANEPYLALSGLQYLSQA